jgi:DNA-binding MarR family transcriptional regulator
MILASLWEKDGVTQTELAGQFHLQAATVTNMLQRMEQAGLVERRKDAEDQRISRVYLTDAGRDIRDQVYVAWSKLKEQAFAGLSTEERNLLHRLLLRIHNNLTKEG